MICRGRSDTMATKTADPNLITDLDADIRDDEDREVIESLVKQSKQLLTARSREKVDADQKTDIWATMIRELTELNSDVSFALDGVKLTWTKGGIGQVSVPDEDKIAKVAPKLVSRRDKLVKELAEIDYELTQLGKAHTKAEKVHVKPKLSVNAIKGKK